MLQKLKDMKYERIPRISSGVRELDWLYGGDGREWGLPISALSIWSSPSGVGKSQSLITVCRKMTAMGKKILYFQNEVPLFNFRSWVGDSDLAETFYASNSNTLVEQQKDIESVKPDLVVVDSINKLKDFGKGLSSNVNKIHDFYRELLARNPTHIIMLCHLNKSGDIKGSSDLMYLSDVSISLDFYIYDNIALARQSLGYDKKGKNNFKILDGHFTIGLNKGPNNKNRYGRTGSQFVTFWSHSKGGAVCVSYNRRYDKEWCEAHNLEVIDYGCLDYVEMGGYKTKNLWHPFYFYPDKYKELMTPNIIEQVENI